MDEDTNSGYFTFAIGFVLLILIAFSIFNIYFYSTLKDKIETGSPSSLTASEASNMLILNIVILIIALLALGYLIYRRFSTGKIIVPDKKMSKRTERAIEAIDVKIENLKEDLKQEEKELIKIEKTLKEEIAIAASPPEVIITSRKNSLKPKLMVCEDVGEPPVRVCEPVRPQPAKKQWPEKRQPQVRPQQRPAPRPAPVRVIEEESSSSSESTSSSSSSSSPPIPKRRSSKGSAPRSGSGAKSSRSRQ